MTSNWPRIGINLQYKPTSQSQRVLPMAQMCRVPMCVWIRAEFHRLRIGCGWKVERNRLRHMNCRGNIQHTDCVSGRSENAREGETTASRAHVRLGKRAHNTHIWLGAGADAGARKPLHNGRRQQMCACSPLKHSSLGSEQDVNVKRTSPTACGNGAKANRTRDTTPAAVQSGGMSI